MKNRWIIVLTEAFAYVFLISLPLSACAEQVETKDFDQDSMAISGDGWEATKYLKKKKRHDSYFVRFEADSEVIHDLRCGPASNAQWTKLHVFKTPEDIPDLLAILYYTGGAHGPDCLRLIQLDNSYPLVFDSGENRFKYIKDLDGDGVPEIAIISLAFDGFNDSAISIGHADSPFPLLIATYDKSRGRYVWANPLFSDVLNEWAARDREPFLKEWSDGKKIPVNIAVEQEKWREDYCELMRWAVDVCYAEGQEAADALIDEYTDPALAVFTKHAFHRTLRHDANYRSMVQNPLKR